MKKRALKKALVFSFLFFATALLTTPAQAYAKSGWVKKSNASYYYTENGTKVKKKLKKIGDYYYYFDSTGKMVKKTMKTIKGSQYYFGKNGKATIGWLTLAGEKYYFDEDGKGVTGLTTIGNATYYFDEDGKMQTGWQYLEEKKAYFYLKTGKMAVNRTIDGATINSKGYAKMTYADKAMVKATEKAEEILATITNDSMTDSQKLRAAYDYMCSRSRFSYVTWRAFQVYDGWEYDYAYEIYTKHGGNCYNFACGFAMMAKVIGYDAYVVRGRVPGSRDGAGDGLTRHACVKINGLYYDPEAQFAGWATGIYGYSTYPMTFQILGSRKI